MTDDGSLWDPSLFAGAAPFYATGRAPYPPGIADRLAETLGLDGSGRLLDLGCGPGSLTLLLAPLFAEVVGVDADHDMLAEAARQAERTGITHVMWRHLRAEQLPADIATPTVVTLAQSLHWMDRRRVAAILRAMLAEGGAVVHVHAQTHRGIDTDERLPYPQPPQEAISALIRRHLGHDRRAGRSVIAGGVLPTGEDDIYRAAGFHGPLRLRLPERSVVRTTEEVRAAVYSRSSSAPHLFGADFDVVDAQLLALLHDGSPGGMFSERLLEVTLSVWR